MSRWQSFVFMCFSQYMSLYISFILIAQLNPREQTTHKKCLHWIFTTPFGIKFCIICSFLQDCLLHPQLKVHTPVNLLLLIWFFDTVMRKGNQLWQKYNKNKLPTDLNFRIEGTSSVKAVLLSLLKFYNSSIFVLAWE